MDEQCLKTGRGNIFSFSFDPGANQYRVDGPISGGSIVPVQGKFIHLSVQAMDRADASEELLKQLSELGF